ncbi:BTAD domain-containing putative transcriptional regulator [Nonomuraea sp. NPDC050556]|uniref:AfsR/SARP family transcriptional regulator n=1 Tax=Nonomuraea sp. NPDC050556 TaxID=3364369 RepID=UPI0037ADFC4D
MSVDQVKFRVLGPVEAGVALTGRQRAFLAVLMLNRGKVVSTGHLIDLVWDDPLPVTVDSQVRIVVSALRKLLGADTLVTKAPGYLLQIGDDDLDLAVFGRLSEEAAKLAAEGSHDLALARYEEALALWRGPALGGVTSRFAEVESARLEASRLRAQEGRAEAMLALGRHGALVEELTRLAAEHPAREPLHALLMTTLHRAGRRGEALAVYRALREHLVAELGLEPTPELSRLHQGILKDSSPLIRQLPAESGPLVGREAELEQLDALSARPGRLLLVAGAAGAGKTALVVHWARGRTEAYPDGQFFLDLRGFDPRGRMPATQALPQLLAALGMAADQIPVEMDQQIGLYRSLMVGKRALLVLDNVGEVEQVRPLLPGDPACMVVLTSRDRLGGLVALDGACRLTLDVLSPGHAVEVLAQTAGPARIAADPAAAAELARLASHLPLALRVVGARLADQPHRSLARFVTELAAAGRVASLSIDDDVRANVCGALGLSYAALPVAAQGMFRLLGLVASPTGLSVAAAASMAAVGPADAERQLDTLARLHLVVPVAEGRFACHDLVRDYAARLAVLHDPAEAQDAAVARLLHFYLRTIHDTVLDRPVPPRLPELPPVPGVMRMEFADEVEAGSWMRGEWDNVVAALNHAAAHGPYPLAWYLASALQFHNHLIRAGSRPEWVALTETALAAARGAGDLTGEAAMLACLGLMGYYAADYRAAKELQGRAVELYREGGWAGGESSALRGHGVTLSILGEISAAKEVFHQALAIERRLGSRYGEFATLNNLGNLARQEGDLAEAVRHDTDALAVARIINLPIAVPGALENLGNAMHQQGRLRAAIDVLTEAIHLFGKIIILDEGVNAWTSLGEVYLDATLYTEAEEAFATALDLAGQRGERSLEQWPLCGMARMDILLGRPEQAIGRLDAVLNIIGQSTQVVGHSGALSLLSQAHHALGDHQQAYEHAVHALDLARGRWAEADARYALAHLGLGDLAQALDEARKALRIQRQGGLLIAQLHTLRLLTRVHHRMGRLPSPYAAKARRVARAIG